METKAEINHALIKFLSNPKLHNAQCEDYVSLNKRLNLYINSISCDAFVNFDLLGYKLRIERTSFGTTSSIDLLSLYELLLFGYYRRNLSGLDTADVGANVGVHTAAMVQAGTRKVVAFEPDKDLHVECLIRNLKANLEKLGSKVEVVDAAVSNYDGTATFVRTLGNSTASHLAGKKIASGPTESFAVNVVDYARLARQFSFAKIDAEGSELDILESIPMAHFQTFSCFVELGSGLDKYRIEQLFFRFQQQRIFFYIQDNAWKAATTVSELPKSWRQGNVYLGTSPPEFI